MKQEFVPYELAVKLKQLGFNEECIAYYDLRNDLEFYGGDNLKDTHCVQLNTPLFQQAFRWFREKGFFVSFSTHDYNIHDFYIKWSIPDRSTLSESILSDAYDTYEEVELACLNKLIEIVELNKL
jgi:hypothetical protein